ncbi:LacI family transcriptional regulator [Roseibium denhamense]|uniref:Transcriptional regulator, LacI family n=1 Tax=Roseibium denhamense TaxID=76305 RepID=A0ABY1NNU8_9HYPH|nr:LacI family DNA-binding transcriptional regulator [Roseibium denhamense]MTI07860.1 LacI family transcriptional regulator [Roseibium denhamense]SMP14481.1 transcriptional regulator, LacI family [Roseibium denhamense]
MPTIKDVARTAGVSVSTVFKVLADNDSVIDQLRQQVLAAMEELDFDPGLLAAGHRNQNIDVIGLIVPDITNPFFAQLAKYIEMEAVTRGLSVMLANSHHDADAERTQVRALQDRAVSGVIVVASSDDSQPFDTDLPIVSLDRRYLSHPLVTTDQKDGARRVADHLHSIGHRRIAYIAGPEHMEVARDRRAGFVGRITELSTPGDPIDIVVQHGQFDFDAGEEIGRRFLDKEPALRPTAIATASDQQAIGVLRCARDIGISVPKQLSVAGFDDIELASLVVPRLTTLRQPIEDLASRALDRLLSSQSDQKDFSIRGSLVVRESTAPQTNQLDKSDAA